MTEWDEDALRRDAFLGGRVHLWQPRKGYRAGVDPVLLAASVPAQAGQAVLDLGCGAGAAALCLGTRVAGLRLVGLERDSAYASLAQRNRAETALEFTVLPGDVADPPAELKQQSFDIVMANPPYYDRSTGSRAPNARREAALGEQAPLDDWVRCAFKRLKPKGYFHMILKADRLADALSAIASRFGSIEVAPLAPRPSRPAELILLRARKEGRAPLILHAPAILHEGDMHPGDRDHYSPAISAVLREGAALNIWAM